jgi:hypothetical protein
MPEICNWANCIASSLPYLNVCATVFQKRIKISLFTPWIHIGTLKVQLPSVTSRPFLCNKTNQMHQFNKFILSRNSTWPGCPILVLLESCLQTCMTYTIAECTVNISWWWTDELSETCRVSWQNEFVKLVHLVGFITQKFVTMHGHMNIKIGTICR